MTLAFRMFPMMALDDPTGGGDPNPPADPAPADPAPAPKDDKTVPYDRFAKVNEKAKAHEEALKAFSAFGTADEIATKLAKLTELEKAQLTAAERDKLEREELAKKAADLEKKALDAETRATQIRIEAEFKLLAKDAVNPNAALKLADLSGVKVEGDTVVGLEEALTALKESDPYLFAKPNPKPIGGATNGKVDEPTPDEQMKVAVDKAKKSGRIEDKVAVAQLKLKLGL